ncbi:MAG: peptidase-like protein, partial [Mucilaginibacter sp.]|nr:peptidase-like protein [Mucilaginibacter sp.]
MLVFAGAIISVLAHIGSSLVVIIILVNRELIAYYMPSQIIYLGVTILYTISLSFSVAGKRFWLKLAGLCGLLIGLPVMFILIYGQPPAQYIQLYTMVRWLAVAASFTPVLFIMNFIDELKKPDIIKTPREMADISLVILGVVMLLFVGYAGIGIKTTINWGNRNFESAEKLYHLMEGRTFVNNKGDTLFYRLLKPLNYDPHKKYPLVVSLPYGGQPGTDKIRQTEGAVAAELLATDENRKKYPAFILVPNCPVGSGWGGVPNYPSV